MKKAVKHAAMVEAAETAKLHTEFTEKYVSGF